MKFREPLAEKFSLTEEEAKTECRKALEEYLED